MSAPIGSVLVIGDGKDVSRSIVQRLADLGCEARSVPGGPAGIAQAVAGKWQALVVGVAIHDDGEWMQLLQSLRQTSDTPILLIGVDAVAGLEAGADACLPKSCSGRRLLACLQAVIRRAAMTDEVRRQRAGTQEFVIADLRIEPASRRVTLAGRELDLTPGQYTLLLSLASARGRVKTRDDLYSEIRATSYNVFDRSLDVQVSCLRRKLGDNPKRPRFIRTVRSAGYLLAPPDAP